MRAVVTPRNGRWLRDKGVNRAAAKKWGLPYEIYKTKSNRELSAMKAWVKRHPGTTGQDYFDMKDQTAA